MKARLFFMFAIFNSFSLIAAEQKVIVQMDNEESTEKLQNLLETVRPTQKPMDAFIFGEYETIKEKNDGVILYAYMKADETKGTIIFHDSVRQQFLPNTELLVCSFKIEDFEKSKYSRSVKLRDCQGPEYLAGITMNITSKSIGQHPNATPLLVTFIHESRGQTTVLRDFEMTPIRIPLYKLLDNFHKQTN